MRPRGVACGPHEMIRFTWLARLIKGISVAASRFAAVDDDHAELVILKVLGARGWWSWPPPARAPGSCAVRAAPRAHERLTRRAAC